MPKVFRNTSYKQRDYEATNIVYAVAEYAPAGTWEHAPEFDGLEDDIESLTGMTKLHIQEDVRFYGYL